MDRFKNKIVLVTGAGSGIGRSTAVRLDQEGATLIIADINEDQLNETKDMLTNKASSAMILDISDLEQTQACFQTVKKEYKTLDALINVAGILRFDNSHEVKIEDWNICEFNNIKNTSIYENYFKALGINFCNYNNNVCPVLYLHNDYSKILSSLNRGLRYDLKRGAALLSEKGKLEYHNIRVEENINEELEKFFKIFF